MQKHYARLNSSRTQLGEIRGSSDSSTTSNSSSINNNVEKNIYNNSDNIARRSNIYTSQKATGKGIVQITKHSNEVNNHTIVKHDAPHEGSTSPLPRSSLKVIADSSSNKSIKQKTNLDKHKTPLTQYETATSTVIKNSKQ